MGVASAAPTPRACSEGRILVRGEAENWFHVEVAKTPQEQRLGLMYRTHLPLSQGMLFVYRRAQPASFWMRNTLIPLDMLFADRTGRIVNIHENAQPLDETPIFGGDAIQYVLEINGGLARQLKISQGDLFMSGAIDQDVAALPCPP